MIGYSKRARTRYHKERGYTGWAKCCLISMDVHSSEEGMGMEKSEAILREGNPHLSRCPKCWKEY